MINKKQTHTHRPAFSILAMVIKSLLSGPETDRQTSGVHEQAYH